MISDQELAMTTISLMTLDSTLRTGLQACDLASMIKEQWPSLLNTLTSWVWRTELVQSLERLCISVGGQGLRALVPKQPNLAQLLIAWTMDFEPPIRQPGGARLSGKDFGNECNKANAVLAVSGRPCQP